MSALDKITPMFLANAAFCIENGSDVKPETRESIIDTLIKASEELSQANDAKRAPTQGADSEHRPGCEALGGYGHGVGPCDCGADARPADKPHTHWTYCTPRDNDGSRFMIIFDDADRPPIVLPDGNEEKARELFSRLEMNWNCHLFELAKREPVGADARPVAISSEPVAWMVTNVLYGSVSFHTEESEARAFKGRQYKVETLMTAGEPPPLTDEEIDAVATYNGHRNAAGGIYESRVREFARDILAEATAPRDKT